MKLFNKILIAVSVSFSFAIGTNAASKTDSLTMSIQAMHCGKCVHKVSKILSANNGIEDFSVDEERRTVTVIFNPAQTCQDSIMSPLKATKRYIPVIYSKDEVMLRTIKQRIADMHCRKCEQRITSALNAMPGIDSLSVDLSGPDILIRYDANKTRKDSIRQTLTKIGFSPVDILLHHGKTVPGISYTYLTIPKESCTDATVETLMAVDGIADVSVNAKKKSLAISYADKYFSTPDALLQKIHSEGINAVVPPAHQCDEKGKTMPQNTSDQGCKEEGDKDCK